MSKPDAEQTPRMQVDSDEDARLANPAAKASESAGAKVWKKQVWEPNAMTGNEVLQLVGFGVCWRCAWSLELRQRW